jgi:hypothetical protein
VNYGQQLERSADYNEVKVLYQQAGLSLQSDLAPLAAAPRIQVDPGALQYLSTYIIFNSDVKIPVLALHIEMLTAFQRLLHRLQRGKWGDATNPDLLNQQAAASSPTLNAVAPAFLTFEPTPSCAHLTFVNESTVKGAVQCPR